MSTSPKAVNHRLDLFIITLFLCVGIWWNLRVEMYDLRWPLARIWVSLAVALVSWVLMDAGLGFFRMEKAKRHFTAWIAVLPWTCLYAWQLAYLGGFLIIFEIGASIFILKRRAPIKFWQGALLVLSVRSVAIAVTFGITPLVRSWYMR